MMNEYIVYCAPLKKCPWCGWPGALDISKLDGYQGNFTVCVKCTNPNCEATRPNSKFNDLYCETQEAVDRAVKMWNVRDI